MFEDGTKCTIICLFHGIIKGNQIEMNINIVLRYRYFTNYSHDELYRWLLFKVAKDQLIHGVICIVAIVIADLLRFS